MMQDFLQVSLWDEGISALVQFEYDKRSVPLDILDLKNCASENAVRIGDILETLFLMAINGDWIYTSEQGEEQVLDEDALNALYAKGRLTDADLTAFAGVWRPR